MTANGSNYRSWLVPDALTATVQLKHADAAPASSVMVFPTPTGTVSQYSWVGVDAASSASTIVQRNASNEVIAANTVGTGKTPMATDTTIADAQRTNKLKTFSVTAVLTGSGTGGLLQDTDDVLTYIWKNELGFGVTLALVSCETDSATASRIQLTRRDGSPANILTDNTGAGLDCSSTAADGTIDTGEDNIADGESVGLTMVTAGGAGKELAVTMRLTID